MSHAMVVLKFCTSAIQNCTCIMPSDVSEVLINIGNCQTLAKFLCQPNNQAEITLMSTIIYVFHKTSRL